MSRSVSPPLAARRRASLGVSLIELMVSMAIGLVVIGAVFTNYLTNSVGSRQTAALTQVTSDASLVLGILRNHIAIAGYGDPTGSNATSMTTNFSGPAILGCDNGFTSTDDAGGVPTLSCSGGSASPEVNALAVRYVTDGSISPTTSTNQPTDCTGAGIDLPPGSPAGTPLIADNRFVIAAGSGSQPPSLSCEGNGGGGSQPLVENVVSMQVRYGVGQMSAAGNGKMLRVIRYVTAADVGDLTSTNWDRVMAVRVCVVVRSTEEVLPERASYMDCGQTATLAPDRRVYRAFTTTVLINNRLSSDALNPAGTGQGG